VGNDAIVVFTNTQENIVVARLTRTNAQPVWSATFTNLVANNVQAAMVTSADGSSYVAVQQTGGSMVQFRRASNGTGAGSQYVNPWTVQATQALPGCLLQLSTFGMAYQYTSLVGLTCIDPATATVRWNVSYPQYFQDQFTLQAVIAPSNRVIVTLPFAILSVNVMSQTIEWIYNMNGYGATVFAASAITSGADPVVVPLNAQYLHLRGFYATSRKRLLYPTTMTNNVQYALQTPDTLVIQFHRSTYAVNTTSGAIMWSTAVPGAAPTPYTGGNTVVRFGAQVAVMRTTGIYFLDLAGKLVRSETFAELSTLCVGNVQLRLAVRGGRAPRGDGLAVRVPVHCRWAEVRVHDSQRQQPDDAAGWDRDADCVSAGQRRGHRD
jgi:hypothetical protein